MLEMDQKRIAGTRKHLCDRIIVQCVAQSG
jgi:hypothetical protein